MAKNDTKTQGAEASAGATFQVVGQYARDVSLECPKAFFEEGADKIGVALDVGVGAKTLDKDKGLHEVSLKLTGKATDEKKEARYLVEVDYAGVFKIEGVPEEHLAAVLSIDGASLIFPFARQVFMDTVAATGYRPGMINPINFQALFLQAQKQEGESKSA